MLSADVICFDYYRTLVKLESPFVDIQEYITGYITRHEPEIDVKKFFGRFTRCRAVLSTAPEFRLGIDILTQSIDRACAWFKIGSFGKEFKSFCEGLFTFTEKYSDADRILAVLSSKYRVGLLTNADNYIIRQNILQNGFKFDFVFTSEDAKANKPDRRIFELAQQKLCITPDRMVMVGDSLFDDISGALAQGMRCIWVNRDNEPLKEGSSPPTWQIKTLSEIEFILG
jgi:2-haloalkanoic acid dehalogenase type II